MQTTEHLTPMWNHQNYVIPLSWDPFHLARRGIYELLWKAVEAESLSSTKGAEVYSFRDTCEVSVAFTGALRPQPMTLDALEFVRVRRLPVPSHASRWTDAPPCFRGGHPGDVQSDVSTSHRPDTSTHMGRQVPRGLGLWL